MNLNHLAIFYAVAETGSVSGAAARLFISQPAVSKQLREFEETIGLTLFDRLPKGMRLTATGEELRVFAQRIFSTEAAAERRLAELRDARSGRLSIGASMTIGNYLLPTLLARYQRRYPGVEVQLDIANTEVIQHKLLENTLDLGFTEGFVEEGELEAKVFAVDQLVVIAAPGHRFSERTDLRAAELCSEPCLLREPGSGTRAVVERTLAARDLHPISTMSLGSPEAIKQAVAAGAGISLVSRWTVATELRAGTLIVLPVIDLSVERPLHQLSLRHKHPSRAVEHFLEMLEHDGVLAEAGLTATGQGGLA